MRMMRKVLLVAAGMCLLQVASCLPTPPQIAFAIAGTIANGVWGVIATGLNNAIATGT